MLAQLFEGAGVRGKSEGACRVQATKGGWSDSPEMWGLSHVECRLACAEKQGCTAYEFWTGQSDYTRCELFTTPV